MILHRNGYPEETWFTHYHSPIRDTSGAIVGVFTVVIEVSEQKRAERALRELNESLAAQVAARTEDRDRMWRLSTDVMLVADFQGRIVAVNPAWTILFGWTEAELLSRNFLELVHRDDRDATLADASHRVQRCCGAHLRNGSSRCDGTRQSDRLAPLSTAVGVGACLGEKGV